MIPDGIIGYLNRENVDFIRRWHEPGTPGEDLERSHLWGRRMVKSVAVDVDGRRMLAVVPKDELVDTELLAQGLGAKRVRPVPEDQFAVMFPDCELGAEPPLGRLYGMPVVIDALYAEGKTIIFHAGSLEETITMRYADYELLEHPQMVRFSRAPRIPAGSAPPQAQAQGEESEPGS